jgi:hypothetical protein
MLGHAGPHSEGDRKRKETTPPEAREDESVQRKALSVNGLVKHILQFVSSESDFKAMVLVCVNPASRREYEPMFRDVQSMVRLEKDVTKMITTTVGTYSCTKVGLCCHLPPPPLNAVDLFVLHYAGPSVSPCFLSRASGTSLLDCIGYTNNLPPLPASGLHARLDTAAAVGNDGSLTPACVYCAYTAYSALWDLQIGDVKNLKRVPDLLYSEGLLLSVMTRFQTMLAEAVLSRRRLGTMRQSWDIYKAVSRKYHRWVESTKQGLRCKVSCA